MSRMNPSRFTQRPSWKTSTQLCRMLRGARRYQSPVTAPFCRALSMVNPWKRQGQAGRAQQRHQECRLRVALTDPILEHAGGGQVVRGVVAERDLVAHERVDGADPRVHRKRRPPTRGDETGDGRGAVVQQCAGLGQSLQCRVGGHRLRHVGARDAMRALKTLWQLQSQAGRMKRLKGELTCASVSWPR